MFKLCKKHGTAYVIECSACMWERMLTPWAPPASTPAITEQWVVWPEGVKLGNKPETNEPLRAEMERQRAEDRAEVESLVDWLRGQP